MNTEILLQKQFKINPQIYKIYASYAAWEIIHAVHYKTANYS